MPLLTQNNSFDVFANEQIAETSCHMSCNQKAFHLGASFGELGDCDFLRTFCHIFYTEMAFLQCEFFHVFLNHLFA